MVVPKFDAQPPMTFIVNEAKLQSRFPGSRDELWSARVTAERAGVFCQVFENILFVESGETAYLYGIEEADGRPKGLRSDLAIAQQEFIAFVRSQTSRDNATLGLIANVFGDHECACEGRVTAAYIIDRNVPMDMGIGYWSKAGVYERVRIAKSDEWFEIARIGLPFDEPAETSGALTPTET